MWVATKANYQLSISYCLARLNGAYGGKCSGISPIQNDGRSHRLINRESVDVYLGKLTA